MHFTFLSLIPEKRGKEVKTKRLVGPYSFFGVVPENVPTTYTCVCVEIYRRIDLSFGYNLPTLRYITMSVCAGVCAFVFIVLQVLLLPCSQAGEYERKALAAGEMAGARRHILSFVFPLPSTNDK